AEKCDGVSTTCPADAVQPASTVCRPALGPCDVADNCNGSSASCPADAVAPPGTPCGSGATCAGAICGDMVGYWKLDEGTDILFHDASGNGHDGTLSGAFGWTAGVSGGALSMNGGAFGYLPGTKAAANFGTGNFTVAGWINTTTNNGVQYILHNRITTCGNTSYWAVRLDGSGHINFELDQDAAGNNY